MFVRLYVDNPLAKARGLSLRTEGNPWYNYYILPFSCAGVHLILVDMSWDMYTKRKLIIPTLVYNMSISDRLARIVALFYIRHASISLNLYSLIFCSYMAISMNKAVLSRHSQI